ncbi:MAG TPA: hypothetical protein VH186_20155 [Chloroflexia bacterium]|nr:hypothetical protein [Chloroflexia bacterium]
MVAVKVRNSDKTLYIIGEFWEIVERLKAQGAYFRFRSRRWRWPGGLSELEATMSPYVVLEGGRNEAHALQLEYDRAHIEPTRQWIKAHTRMSQLSVEWWQEAKLGRRQDSKARKEYEQYRERVELAFASLDILAEELERDQITALQQTQRTVEKYEGRIVKWLADRTKARRREELLARFEQEMGYTRDNLLEAEAARGAARQALYEEVAGLDWLPHEISELKVAARALLKQRRQEKISVS